MVLGFRQKHPRIGPTKFKDKILSGEKIHTIREDKSNRWYAGRKIQMAYGVRTKFYERFYESNCISVESIEINWCGLSGFSGMYPDVKISGRKLSYSECDELAQNDGFESFVDFIKWFSEDFKGKIIHWTNKRYVS
ncbi:hypothetical protein JWG44_05610 [Leptospira sp. 201903071]|uniref:hypothetical protein n=1 Tax=Leptospira ainazelensis TaxID=2810034 RepID=UPI001963470E|nr:hypothetical protein [Leptospira ainazelensis]MBM9499726.1 hypothetical protein [Leptospira ainazelensis]